MKDFEISLEGMQEVSQMLMEAFKKGLEDEEKAVVKMFITYVHSLPDGTEEGDFLALDLGGSNFRVLLLSKISSSMVHVLCAEHRYNTYYICVYECVDANGVDIYTFPCNAQFVSGLEKGGKMKEPKVMKTKISLEKKQGTQEELFDFIAQSMADFMKEYNITRKLPLGFTFSFPVKQTSLTTGVLKKWTKDFKGSGAVGRDVIEMLQEALARRKVSQYLLSLSTNLQQQHSTLSCSLAFAIHSSLPLSLSLLSSFLSVLSVLCFSFPPSNLLMPRRKMSL